MKEGTSAALLQFGLNESGGQIPWNAIAMVAKIITCSFSALELISDYSHSRTGHQSKPSIVVVFLMIHDKLLIRCGLVCVACVMWSVSLWKVTVAVEANDWRNREHVVLDLFSNWKWVRSSGYFW